nr:FkbM family methyltransferase [uncultured Rhodopila sp.]
MDLARIRAFGQSRTRKALLTNPLRAMLWQLILPYFQGIAEDFDRRQNADLASLRQEAASSVASHLAGARKDAAALAHRLAGLEEEAVALAHRQAGLEEETAAHKQARLALAAVVDATVAEAREVAAYVAALHQDFRQSGQILEERLGSLSEQIRTTLGEATSAAVQAREAAAYVVSLHRGATLRAGDRLAVGQDGLTLAATDTGTRFLVRQHDLIGGLVADGREWEPHVRAAIARAARRDGVAVDAGAYIGLHTVTMSMWFGTVHAFEPQRGIYQVLCGNLALNSCANVEAHNLALYDRAGLMRLAPPQRQQVASPQIDGRPDYAHSANAAALTFEIADDGVGDVRCVALDDLGLERVALIKVDTQGADLRVLRGAEGTIRRCRPTVLFEWERDLSAQHGDAMDDYHAFFAALDYDVSVLQETSPGRQIDYLATPR